MGNESIFKSAIRAFCVALFAMVGIVVAIFVIVLVLSGLGGGDVTGTYDYSLLPDHRGKRELLTSHDPAVLWINLQGEVGVKSVSTDAIAELLAESREGVLAGNRVKAIMLNINSPGGAATDAENIYHLLLEYKERYHIPIYAYVDGLCASGGMMIGCAADKIYATESSIVGSVGVISNFFNAYGLLDKVGVQSLVLSEGKGKADLWPTRPWQPGEDKNIMEIMDFLYGNFVSIVSKARPQVSKDDLINKYGAQVFSAPMALQLGFIDGLSNTSTLALQELVKAAGITDAYQVIELYPSNWIHGLFDSKSPIVTGKVTHQVEIPGFKAELANKFLYLYQPNS